VELRAIYNALCALLTRSVGPIPSDSGGSGAVERGVDRERAVAAYEARPTRMFGAYTIWALYADGSSHQCDHGTPQYCLEEATRLNAMLLRRRRNPMRR
jgi:hypothetical protein